jgi:hypothetical protein
MSDIKTVTLSFPHGISMREAQAISIRAELVTNQGISEGGYRMLTNPFMMGDDEPLEFSKDEAHFLFSYIKDKS